MSNNVVYVVQEPRKRDGDGWKPLYDLSPALKFGTLSVLIPHGPILLDSKLMIEGLKDKLKDYRECDHIMLVGDPTAMAAAVMVAGQFTGGKVRLLKYDRAEKQYNSILLEL